MNPISFSNHDSVSIFSDNLGTIGNHAAMTNNGQCPLQLVVNDFYIDHSLIKKLPAGVRSQADPRG